MADLSFLNELYGIRPTQDYGMQEPEQPDPVQSVNELLRTLETARPPEPHKLKTWQTVLGGLGDALQSMAAVRAGGGPIPVGPFASGQRERRLMYEQQVADVDKYNRETGRAVRIGQFEENQRRQREESLERIRLTRPEDPLERDRLKETERHNRAMEGRPTTSVNPETERHNREMERLSAERNAQGSKPRRLPPGIVTKIAEQSSAYEAAKAAKDAYTFLKKPDLGTIFTMTPDRLKNKDAIKARRIISEALVPLRKYFLGSAVSEGEKSAAEPLLANLEGGVAPEVLEQSLIGLMNIAERARRNELTTAEMGGFDISGFPTSSTAPQPNDPTVSAPGGRQLRVVIDENGDLKVEE